MRCSSFEPSLTDFVEGALGPAEHARVLSHTDECDGCRALLQELRVIDALLLTPRQLDPAPNFTIKTMVEVRALATPRIRRTPALGVVVTYLAFAWTIIGAWLAFGGGAAHETLASAGALLTRYGIDLAALAAMTLQLFGHSTLGVTALMGMVVVLDVVAGVMLAVLYTAVRPRLAKRLARITESIG